MLPSKLKSISAQDMEKLIGDALSAALGKVITCTVAEVNFSDRHELDWHSVELRLFLGEAVEFKKEPPH
jgi:hypothetical protein